MHILAFVFFLLRNLDIVVYPVVQVIQPRGESAFLKSTRVFNYVGKL